MNKSYIAAGAIAALMTLPAVAKDYTGDAIPSKKLLLDNMLQTNHCVPENGLVIDVIGTFGPDERKAILFEWGRSQSETFWSTDNAWLVRMDDGRWLMTCSQRGFSGGGTSYRFLATN